MTLKLNVGDVFYTIHGGYFQVDEITTMEYICHSLQGNSGSHYFYKGAITTKNSYKEVNK